jgi:hypothetical protein
LHGTTALPKEGVTCNFSQNLAKRTVTAIKKWKGGEEQLKHKNYRLNQLQQDPPAREALLKSLEKINNVRNNEIILEGDIGYESNQLNLDSNFWEWF